MIRTALLTLALCLSAGPALAQAVATEPLRRGTVLTDAMLEGSGTAALIGRQLVRPIFPGKPVSLSDTETPDIVTRQSPVTLVFRRNGLSLSLQGRAMADGGMGEVVTVLVEGRRRPLRGVVVGSDTVEVSG